MLISTNKLFLKLVKGFAKLWNIQNDYFLWSMKHND